MNVRSNVFRGLVTLIAGACLAVGAAAPVSAAPRPEPSLGMQSHDQSAGERKADVGAAACPTGGQRVRTSSSGAIYLVGPGLRLYWIPDENVYFSLWDSWNGIVTNDSLWSCYVNAVVLYDGRLVKQSGSPKVYIWDHQYGERWIPDEATFNKYAFSWSKIRTESLIYPSSSDWT